MVILRKYATLNVNCIQGKHKQQLLNAFISQNDIDVLLLQEVNNDNFDFLGPQYEYVVNTGENNRGTAIIYRAGMNVEQVETHPSGRVISMNINNTQFINVYLPSGTNYRQERENFISKEIPFYLRHRYNRLLIGGDWNCVLHAKDQTGKYNPSPALDNLTRELQLMDIWELFHGNDVEYTFRRQNVSSRIDRFYITRPHSTDVYRIQVIPTPFSDHDCVCLSMQTDTQLPLFGKSYWKLNDSLLFIPEYRDQFVQYFETLNRRVRNSKFNIMEKWMKIIKPGFKSFYQAAGIQRAQETRATLNFYYQILAELYETQKPEGNKWKDIVETKLKICEIHKKLMHGVMVRARVPTIHEEERCALYHLVKEKRKSRTKYIEQLRTAEGKIANTSKECIKEVEEFFTSLYAASPTSQKATADILKSVNRHLSLQQQQDLQSPITEEEIRLALEGAPKNTAPGPDGLTYQVYKNHWRLIKEYLIELMNYILDTDSVIDGFSDGVVTLIPKTTHPTTVSEYRPITLLNTDYKLFMKVLANRLKPAFRNIFEIGQTCGVPEKSIIHNLATIRDTVLYFMEELYVTDRWSRRR
ncbi:hypothetical protein ANN_08863 [Periplaneta americana]|uniref:Endonuclease/exonuclease/phosphatase domain-containing protein n=1 Tax=Periplaneta americana TaxID=6978 RepID=A0ABQ8T4W2_PERAM|nr:hypothetical protein ANN_08863 [Periplaneta americana]